MAAEAAERSIPLTCSGHTRPVVHLEYSEKQDDGTFLMLSSCKDGNPMLRDWLGDWIGTFLGHKAGCAVTGSADFSAKVWDTYTGDCQQTFSHNHIVRSVAVNAAGDQLFTGGHEKKLRLFDLQKTQSGAAEVPASEAQVFRRGMGTDEATHSSPIRSVVLGRGSASRENIVVTAEDKKLAWWDTRTLQPTYEMSFDEPIIAMDRCANSPSELITVASGKDALFIDLASHDIVKKHTLPVQPSSVSLHPKQDVFVAGCVTDEWVRIYDYNTADELQLHKGHHGPVHCVSYSPDGEVSASGSEDGTVRLWQTSPGKKYGLWA